MRSLVLDTIGKLHGYRYGSFGTAATRSAVTV